MSLHWIQLRVGCLATRMSNWPGLFKVMATSSRLIWQGGVAWFQDGFRDETFGGTVQTSAQEGAGHRGVLRGVLLHALENTAGVRGIGLQADVDEVTKCPHMIEALPALLDQRIP